MQLEKRSFLALTLSLISGGAGAQVTPLLFSARPLAGGTKRSPSEYYGTGRGERPFQSIVGYGVEQTIPPRTADVWRSAAGFVW